MKNLLMIGLVGLVCVCGVSYAAGIGSTGSFGPLTVSNDVATAIEDGSYLVFPTANTCQLFRCYVSTDYGTNLTLSIGPTGGQVMVARTLHAQGMRVGTTNYQASVWNSLAGSAGATNTLVFSLSTFADEKGQFFICATNASLNTILSAVFN
jgi:hypothetical protein